MKTISQAGLLLLLLLATGCPHNDYTVELTPHEKSLARKLIFYRADGLDTNGVPNYQRFPSNELAAITALYSPGQVTQEGERHFASGEFSGALPKDVGGAGSSQFFTTSLGAAVFYVERFRGSDDLAARTAAQLAAADALTDLLLGWCRGEFGREPGWKNLRRFLDGDFRRDLKNLSLYSWAGELTSAYATNASEEFIVRFGQYLHERGYLKVADASGWMRIYDGENDASAWLFFQKFLAEKLGVPAAGPMPKSLAVLADPAAVEQSWKKYLAGTRLYQVRLRQWESEKKTKPDLQKPEPAEAVNDLLGTLLAFGSFGEDDHLTVRLSLAAAPDHTNGRWDVARQQVIWESNLEAAQPARRLPVFCYADWSHADEVFQKEHFGRVILEGDDLLKYCLWHGGLDAVQVSEWEKWLTALRPDWALTNQVAAFQFSADAAARVRAADFGKDLLKSALEHKP